MDEKKSHIAWIVYLLLMILAALFAIHILNDKGLIHVAVIVSSLFLLGWKVAHLESVILKEKAESIGPKPAKKNDDEYWSNLLWKVR